MSLECLESGCQLFLSGNLVDRLEATSLSHKAEVDIGALGGLGPNGVMHFIVEEHVEVVGLGMASILGKGPHVHEAGPISIQTEDSSVWLEQGQPQGDGGRVSHAAYSQEVSLHLFSPFGMVESPQFL